MSWSLEVRNGDLTVGNASLGVVTAEQKLVQDLRHYLLEKMGTDNLHPGYGSNLDSAIGSDFFGEAALFVESEIRRICAEYQERQIERAKADRYRYNKTTFTAGELLLQVDSVDLLQNGPTLSVNIALTTGSDRSVILSLPLEQQQLFRGI
jgi:hypothetical protein